MPFHIDELQGGELLHVKLSGKLTAADYDTFVPTIERLIEQHGKLSLVVEMHDFEGWNMGALWEDIKFDAKHFNAFHRLALVGDSKWESAMATFCKPFTSAEVRYFDQSESQAAIAWAGETSVTSASTRQT